MATSVIVTPERKDGEVEVVGRQLGRLELAPAGESIIRKFGML
jgi:hypothetical protein